MKRKPTQKLNFTKRALEAIPIPPEGQRVIVFDTGTRGLGFMVFPSGARSFFHRRFAGGSAARTTIGRFEPDGRSGISIDQARGKAAELNAKLAKWKNDGSVGPHPLAKVDRATATFKELLDAYIRSHVALNANNRENAERQLRWIAEKYFKAWYGRRIDSIRIGDVIALRDSIGPQHRYQANRVVERLRAIFNWSAGRKDGKVNFWRLENPATDVALYPEEKRKRFLQPDEMQKFNQELQREFEKTPREGEDRPDLDLHDFLTLALATGARRSNVLAMRWSDISFERANWHVPFSKSGEGYDVALTAAAITVLRRRQGEVTDDAVYVFPGCGKSGHLLDMKKQWD
ncbi:MAG TPA: tyrosine-type recombinase/integrase, partial [Candidatus Acidoferrales bacterium]|nr:tyrosine-type recombinase/integrase [Candidatus Acidoferrales bacterium]